MSIETIARRYATALADVVSKDSGIVKGELQEWEKMMRENSSLMATFNNPAIAHMSKERVLESLISKAKPNKTTANFLRVLLRNSRLVNLAEINQAFERVVSERSGAITAKVEAARELSDAEKAELKKNLEKMTNKSVSLNFSVDKELIGGVVATIGSTVYDSSVRTQLNNLKEQLVNG